MIVEKKERYHVIDNQEIGIILSKKYNVEQEYNKNEICPHLKFENEMNNTKVKQYQVVAAILYRLKTGCQWRQLPMKQFFRVK